MSALAKNNVRILPVIDCHMCFIQDLISDYICDCPPGYTGKNCSIDINECLAADCPGNSTCVEDALDSFACICNPGFTGDNCTGK